MFILASFFIGICVASAAAGKGETLTDSNLREKPNTESASQRLIPKGTALNLISKENNWYKVEVNGLTGYIRSDLIRVTQEITASTGSYLVKGDKGEAITEMQNALIRLGFLKGVCDGEFGDKTEKAVIDFQTANKLYSDGVAGPKTLALLYSGTAKTAASVPASTPSPAKAIPKPASTATPMPDIISPENAPLDIPLSEYNDSPSENDVELTAPAEKPSEGDAPSSKPVPPKASDVELIDWSTADKLWKIGEVAWAYDTGTGRMYRLRRFGGVNHADVEPLTKWDTQEMYEIFNKKWTWTPRPVWIMLPDGHIIAASTHDNPHMMSTIKDNGFDGHLCVHFLGSKTHNGNASYTATHQATVQASWQAALTSK